MTSDTAGIRSENRGPDQLRSIRFQNHIAPHATGSTLIEWGQTRVVCGVTIEENVPRWMKEQKKEGGWITAEYSMLPYSTLTRKQRDATKGRIDGRSQEIQRLIGRALAQQWLALARAPRRRRAGDERSRSPPGPRVVVGGDALAASATARRRRRRLRGGRCGRRRRQVRDVQDERGQSVLAAECQAVCRDALRRGARLRGPVARRQICPVPRAHAIFLRSRLRGGRRGS